MHGQSTWHTNAILFQSPTLADSCDAGMQVNFIQERGAKPYFDHMFDFSSAHSCCVRDAFQAMKRVRQFGSPELYYCLDTLSNPKKRRLLCTSLEAAGRHVKRMAWLQEHYCGEQVLSTEEDILEQVLAFDPEDDAAAAKRLRALKEQLCIARQQGMPSWLADVHSHTILESHLSKGYHGECFGLFLQHQKLPQTPHNVIVDSQSALLSASPTSGLSSQTSPGKASLCAVRPAQPRSPISKSLITVKITNTVVKENHIRHRLHPTTIQTVQHFTSRHS